MIHNIIDFGAAGDGMTLNTRAIQRAIDACNPGDTVLVPAGRFISGALFLHGQMTLALAAGAVLKGSCEISDYPVLWYRFEGREEWCYASLLNTYDMQDPPSATHGRVSGLNIEGPGTVDGSGNVLIRKELAAGTTAAGEKLSRGRTVALRNVDNLTIKNVTIRNSPAWCVHLIFCNNVLLEGVHIASKFAEDGSSYDVFNGDGLDPDSCRHVEIRNCLIESQDDCIAVKSGRDVEGRRAGLPCEDIFIHDCVFRYGFGVAIGSEMSGGVRNVLTENCRFEDTFSIASVKAPRGRGGVIENITYRNCAHVNRNTGLQDTKWFRGSIYVDQFYGHEEFDEKTPANVNEGTPVIRNLTFEGLTTDTAGGHSLYFCGLPECHLRHIALRYIKAHGRLGAFFANAEDITLDHVEISSEG